jgi:mRNA interferase HigB
MKVHLIKKQTIEDYAIQNAGSRLSLNMWLNILKYADWEFPENIQETFRSADLLGKGRNKYKMICKYAFGHTQVHLFVCWLGTHDAYSRLCKQNMQFDVNNY